MPSAQKTNSPPILSKKPSDASRSNSNLTFRRRNSKIIFMSSSKIETLRWLPPLFRIWRGGSLILVHIRRARNSAPLVRKLLRMRMKKTRHSCRVSLKRSPTRKMIRNKSCSQLSSRPKRTNSQMCLPKSSNSTTKEEPISTKETEIGSKKWTYGTQR